MNRPYIIRHMTISIDGKSRAIFCDGNVKSRVQEKLGFAYHHT